MKILNVYEYWDMQLKHVNPEMYEANKQNIEKLYNFLVKDDMHTKLFPHMTENEMKTKLTEAYVRALRTVNDVPEIKSLQATDKNNITTALALQWYFYGYNKGKEKVDETIRVFEKDKSIAGAIKSSPYVYKWYNEIITNKINEDITQKLDTVPTISNNTVNAPADTTEPEVVRGTPWKEIEPVNRPSNKDLTLSGIHGPNENAKPLPQFPVGYESSAKPKEDETNKTNAPPLYPSKDAPYGIPREKNKPIHLDGVLDVDEIGPLPNFPKEYYENETINPTQTTQTNEKLRINPTEKTTEEKMTDFKTALETAKEMIENNIVPFKWEGDTLIIIGKDKEYMFSLDDAKRFRNMDIIRKGEVFKVLDSFHDYLRYWTTMPPADTVKCEHALKPFEEILGYSPAIMNIKTSQPQTVQPPTRTRALPKEKKEDRPIAAPPATVNIDKLLMDIEQSDRFDFEYKENNDWLTITVYRGESRTEYHLTPENMKNTDYNRFFDEFTKMIKTYHENGIISKEYYDGMLSDLNDFKKNIILIRAI